MLDREPHCWICQRPAPEGVELVGMGVELQPGQWRAITAPRLDGSGLVTFDGRPHGLACPACVRAAAELGRATLEAKP